MANSRAKKKQALPEGWREVRLGDVCSIDDRTLSSKTPDDYCFDYISLSDVDKGKLLQTQKYRYSDAPSRARRIVTKGDVLLATVRPNLQGFYVFRNEIDDCIVSTGFAVLSPKKGRLDSLFLYQTLFSNYMLATYHAFNVGSNYPAINSSDTRRFKIAIPALSRQKAIASVLQTWDTAIEKTEALIAAKEKQFKWLLKRLISDQKGNPEWRKVTLGEVGLITSAGVDKKVVQSQTQVRLVNYLDVLRKDFISSDDLNHWVTAPGKKVVQCNVQKGDVFFTPSSEIQGDIAHSAVATEDIEKAVYSYHVVRFRIRESWDTAFKAYAFKSLHFYRQARKLCEGSGQRYVISQNSFRSMTIFIPDIKGQKSIGKTLLTAQKEICRLKNLANFYRIQKRALMQKLITGEWRVQL